MLGSQAYTILPQKFEISLLVVNLLIMLATNRSAVAAQEGYRLKSKRYFQVYTLYLTVVWNTFHEYKTPGIRLWCYCLLCTVQYQNIIKI